MSKWTRRHYLATARILRDFREARKWDGRTLDALEAEFSRVFAADNPAFRPEMFALACIPNPQEK